MSARCCLFVLSVALWMTASVQAVDGAKSLFNGKDLTGWKGNPELWSVKDGCITGTVGNVPLKFNTFLVWQDGEVADFELELDYKMVGNNSGIQYRSKLIDAEKFIVGGYQADIDTSKDGKPPRYSGINYEEKGRGTMAERGQRTTVSADGKKHPVKFAESDDLAKHIKVEDWNHYKIVAKGNVLSHYINGHLMSEVIDNQVEKAATKGVLAFQIHVGPPMVVQFKNIFLKEWK